MAIFKTKYRVVMKNGYYYVYKTKWYWFDWHLLDGYESLEDAKNRIAAEKANPVWEEYQ
jgi:hypothetical protein